MNKNLYNALKSIFNEQFDRKIIEVIAKILEICLTEKEIRQKQINAITKKNPEDILFLTFEKKLLIPKSSYRGLEWDDSKFLLSETEKYKMPKIIKSLVKYAMNSGVWNSEEAIKTIFKNIKEDDYDKMPRLVRRLYNESENYRTNGYKIKEICKDFSLKERTGAIISELKGTGIISPQLNFSLFSSLKNRSPSYELNPSLY